MPFRSSLRSWVRSQDFFGHQVSLNFDKNGGTHNTIIGGFFSIFIRAFITWYVVIRLWKMIFFQADMITYTESLQDLDARSEVKFRDANFLVFAVLKHLDHGRTKQDGTDSENLSPIFLDENVERLIELLFIQSKDDFDESETSKMFTREPTRAK